MYHSRIYVLVVNFLLTVGEIYIRKILWGRVIEVVDKMTTCKNAMRYDNLNKLHIVDVNKVCRRIFDSNCDQYNMQVDIQKEDCQEQRRFPQALFE